jgi:ABC-type phosphate/phosphonate transport system substrate-binding protein
MKKTGLLRLGIAMVLTACAVCAVAEEVYVFTAPPRESGGAEWDAYEPIAQYLGSAIGKKIEYRHYDNWLTYQDRMRRGEYDIVFDGPHFLGWRMAKLGHEPVARLAGKLAFVVATRKDNDKIASLKDLAGRTVCGLAPPNLATLTVLSEFHNPARQPLVREVKSFGDAYQDMANGKCVAAILRDNVFAQLDKDKGLARLIYRSEGIANQGFSVGPRLTSADKARIGQALLAAQARQRLKVFFDRYSKDKDLVVATREEYQDLGRLLRDVWGFDLTPDPAGR